MTPTTTSGAADLLTLIEAYAEARHRQGHSSYNTQTAAALQAVKDALAAGQATAAQPAPATQQAGIPGNFITHRAAWREALETAKFFSTGVDRSYWDHELAAFDRSFDRLWTLMQDAPRKQGATQ